MTEGITYIITPEGVTVFSNGQSYTLSSTHGNFNAVIDAIRNKESAETIVDLLNPRVALTKYLGEKFEVGENTVKFNGEEVHGTLVQRIIECHRDNLPVEPLLRFFENLEDNPSFSARTELYDFLAHRNMPITPDGCFLAYKSVRPDFTDHHTGKFSNRVGTVLEMERRKVDDDRNNGCSYGFHAGSLEYATTFGGNDRKVLVVKINPADVVSVPTDCDCQKLRTARYEVVDLYNGPLRNTIADDSNLYEDEDEYGSTDTVSVSNIDRIEDALESIRDLLADLRK